MFSCLVFFIYQGGYMIFGVMLFLWLLSVGCYAFGLYWGSKAIVQIIAERQEKK